MLIDSATDFTLELVSFEDWSAIVDRGEAVPPDYPFGTLPILTFGHGARGGSDSHVSEPSAILTFLEGKLSPLGSARVRPFPSSPPLYSPADPVSHSAPLTP